MSKIKEWLENISYSVLLGSDETECSAFSADSRNVGPGTAFLCMKGSVTDSHDFIPDVVGRGSNVIICEKDLDELDLPDDISGSGITLIKVEDSRAAMAYISSAYFGHPSSKLKMIGITGTKGKTSTAFIIKKILELNGKKTGIIGTVGCEINGKHYPTKNTTPDSFELNERFAEMVKEGCEYCVMECSSQGFKLHRTDGIEFDYGVFLNISPDHIGPLEHDDFDEYLACKAGLLRQSKKLIINGSDDNFERILKEGASSFEKIIVFGSDDSNEPDRELLKTYSEDHSYCFCTAHKYVSDPDFAGIEFNVSGSINGTFALSMPGDYNIGNALSGILIAEEEKLSFELTKTALRNVYVAGRTEIVVNNENCMVIVDYAHNEFSMVNLMQTLSHYEHKRLVVLFGCGGNRSKDRRTGMGREAAHAADFCIFTADNSRFEKTEDIIKDIEDAYLSAGGKKENYVCIPDRREAIYYALKNSEKGDIIAVIGKGHEDYQEENGVRKHFLDSEEIIAAKERIDNENQSK